MNFDFYGGTLPAGPDEVLASFWTPYGAPSVCRPLYSYEKAVEFARDGETACRVFWGGVNGEESVHVQASGASTGEVVSHIRANWADHRVSRADACEDWCSEEAWRRLSKICLAVRKEFGLASALAGDWIGRCDGRTLYLGGRTSRVRARLYEKGVQLDADPNWVRAEIQVRPSGECKANLATVQPVELFGVSPWTRALAERFGVPELDAIRIQTWRPSDDERALKVLLSQYGGVLRRTSTRVGGWTELGAELGRRLSGGVELGASARTGR